MSTLRGRHTHGGAPEAPVDFSRNGRRPEIRDDQRPNRATRQRPEQAAAAESEAIRFESETAVVIACGVCCDGQILLIDKDTLRI
jgi:hypothetical protein